jgi:hypothetical protein
VGRVCPRHGHGGRPLNEAVRPMSTIAVISAVLALCGCSSVGTLPPATPSNIIGTWHEQTTECPSTITFGASSSVIVVTGTARSTGSFTIGRGEEKGLPVSRLEITFGGGSEPEDRCTGEKQVVPGEKYVANVWVSADSSRMKVNPEYLSSYFTFIRE